MARPRVELHEKLVEILRSRNVYFQPPSSFRMNYPCIRYKLSGEKTFRADNGRYVTYRRYAVMVIDTDPDSPLIDRMAALPRCEMTQCYTADNLHHYVYDVYY